MSHETMPKPKSVGPISVLLLPSPAVLLAEGIAALKRKRPGSAPSRGAGWQRARKAVSRDSCCAVCGVQRGQKSVALPVDHVIASRFIEQHKLGDPNATVNLVTLCPRCHPKKRRAENRLC
ncbi:hypothetical protein LCGC14_1344320, partial [marine sediment metagenome]